MVAERKKVKIDALLLHGYAHDNMFDIIKWQNNNGGGAMIMINSVFDRNDDDAVDRENMNSKMLQCQHTEAICSTICHLIRSMW